MKKTATFAERAWRKAHGEARYLETEEESSTSGGPGYPTTPRRKDSGGFAIDL